MNSGRPNPFLHMIGWCVSSGTILTTGYMIVVVGIFGGIDEYLLSALIRPSLWWFAFLFGGLPCALMGLFSAFIIWATLPDTVSEIELNLERFGIIISSFVISIVLCFLLIGGHIDSLYNFFLFAIPPFLAGIVVSSVANQYLNKLALWCEGKGKRKAKAKYDGIARLSDQSLQGTINTISVQASGKREPYYEKQT